MSARRSSKKPKPNQPSPPASPMANARVSLTTLPIEILAEILLSTRSPPTVLAVSRTCSSLYRFLVQNPAASFIWRNVRQICEPVPLPGPGNLWKKGEASYAAFVFGGGVCEVCRKNTRAMYSSFACQIRLCGSWRCQRKLFKEHLIDATLMFQGERRQSLWVPYVESSSCFHPSPLHVSSWPDHDSILLRKTDLAKFEHDLVVFKDTEDTQVARTPTDGPRSLSKEEEGRVRVMKRCYAAVQIFPAIMELSAQLSLWKVCYEREQKSIKQYNKAWTKDFTTRVGWDLGDLIASQTYGSLQRRKNLLLEKIKLSDVSAIRSTIESELVAMQGRHKRQNAEATYKAKLSEIKKIYERIRCGTVKDVLTGALDSRDSLVLPPMSVFCTLPSIRALKGSPDPNTVLPNNTPAASDMKSSLAMSLITSDVRTWLIPVQKHLMRLLDFPNGWQSASALAVPPLQRVTARFFCRKCGEGKVGRGYQRERCLDFKGVCSHVCVVARENSIEGMVQEAPQEEEIEVTDAGDGEGEEKRKGDGKGRRKKGVKAPDWNVELFDKDDKAIRLIKTILHLRNLSDRVPSTRSILEDAKSPAIRCMSCNGWIVMDFETAIGHARRHESMQIQLLPNSIPDCVEPSIKDPSAPTGNVHRNISNERLAFERGTSELLLEPSHRASHLCKKINYGCRHCLLVEERNVVGIEKTGLGVNGRGVRAMTFHGLRSHVKEKHGIKSVRDEDFFCYTSIQNDERKTSHS